MARLRGDVVINKPAIVGALRPSEEWLYITHSVTSGVSDGRQTVETTPWELAWRGERRGPAGGGL